MAHQGALSIPHIDKVHTIPSSVEEPGRLKGRRRHTETTARRSAEKPGSDTSGALKEPSIAEPVARAQRNLLLCTARYSLSGRIHL